MGKFELMALPYAPDALEPVISKETILTIRRDLEPLSRPLANPRQETQFATGRDRPAQKIWYESQSSRPTGDSFRFFSWRYWR